MIIAMEVNTYYKRDRQRPEALEFEAAGLRWLSSSVPDSNAPDHNLPDPSILNPDLLDFSALHSKAQDSSARHPDFPDPGRLNSNPGVVRIVREGPGFLETELVPQGECTPSAARSFGHRLAAIHALGADWYGQPPAGYSGAGFIGLAPLPLVATAPEPAGEATGTWGKFYAEERLLPYLAPTRDQGTFDQCEVQIMERLLQRLCDGGFESSEPKKVVKAGFSASRIHGDLWSGNVLWSPTGAVLIDPASSGGHAETDLASLGIFGQRYLEQIYAGYQEISPLASGWEERVRLHQLHLLIVHAYLFGGSYGKETVAVAKYYVGG